MSAWIVTKAHIDMLDDRWPWGFDSIEQAVARVRKYGLLPPATEDEMLEALMVLGPTLGYLTYHTHDSRHSPAGYPDVSLIGNGMAVWVELKGEGERMTPAQERYAKVIGDLPHPCWHFLVHPSTYDNLVARLTTWREEYRNGRKAPTSATD